jgi:hypothetical protein
VYIFELESRECRFLCSLVSRVQDASGNEIDTVRVDNWNANTIADYFKACRHHYTHYGTLAPCLLFLKFNSLLAPPFWITRFIGLAVTMAL